MASSSLDSSGRFGQPKWPRTHSLVASACSSSFSASSSSPPSSSPPDVASSAAAAPPRLNLSQQQLLLRSFLAMKHLPPLPSSLPPPLSSSSSSPLDRFLSLKLHHAECLASAANSSACGRSMPPPASSSSPLSPQESTTSFPLHPAHESQRFLLHSDPPCVQSQPSSLCGDHHSLTARAGALSNDVQLSDLPIVCGAAAFQSPPLVAAAPSLRNGSSSNSSGCSSIGTVFSTSYACGNARPNVEQAERLKRTLEDLERELLSDDSDLTERSIFDRELPIAPDPPERDWTDVIEDLLSAESSPFAPVDCSSTALLDQSTITWSSGEIERSTDATVSQPNQLLLSCAAAIDQADFELASSILVSLKQSVSIYGDPMQRLAAYMAEGLAARIESSIRGQSNCSLKRKEPSVAESRRAAEVLYRSCPYFKFGYMAANGAIAEAFRTEARVHIVDFEIGQGNQWPALIGAFSRRPGGPPHVRLTGVADPNSLTSPSGGLERVGQHLKEVAQAAGVRFQFNALPMEASQVQPWMLDRRPGEALAVNFAFQLHHMPDESVSTSNPRDSLLRKVRAMEPKVVTLVEHEANTNTAPFYPRFVEALSYFSAVFESLEASQLAKDSRDRVTAEQHCLARDIVNIVACEGSERVERYEVGGKWRARMSMAGFRPCPLSSFINRTIKELLQHYSPNYRLREEAGALYLDWLHRGLIVASAWN